jgi:transposase
MYSSKKKQPQQTLWIPTEQVKTSPMQAFYDQLNVLLTSIRFEAEVHRLCGPFYDQSGNGRPGIDPVVYFKMLIVGFYEGLNSERALAARCADSLAIRHFLAYDLHETTPDHSSLSRIRKRLGDAVYTEVFRLITMALAQHKLIKGKALGMDTSVMDANASLTALRSKLTGESYDAYVKRLAEESGVDPTDRAAVVAFDRKRKNKKLDNAGWENPNDPGAKIGRTKKGNTRMIYKTEHVVDLDTGAIVDVDILPGDVSDTEELPDRVEEALERASDVLEEAKRVQKEEESEENVQREGGKSNPEEDETKPYFVADAGYFKGEHVADMEQKVRTVIPPPKKEFKGANYSEDDRGIIDRAVKRTQSDKGKHLLKQRANLVERTFHHVMDCGGGRRATLRGYTNILKTYLVRATCCNLSLLMRHLFGLGTMRQTLAAS